MGLHASSLRAAIAGALCALAASVASAAGEEPAAAPAAPAEAAAPAPAADATPAVAEAAAPPPPAPEVVAAWPPPPLPELPDRDPVRAAVDRAWRLPAASLAERVARAQRAGLALGLRELDGPARALLIGSEYGDARTRAQHAVELAPGLPAAHAQLARAQLEAGNLNGAFHAFAAALEATPAHLEARAFAQAALAQAATHAAFVWVAWFALLGAVAALPNLTYGLGATRLKLAGPAALVSIGTLVSLLALAEGPAGAVLGLAAIAMASGSALKRAGVAATCAAAVLGLHGGLARVAEGRLLLAADPVAVAIHRVEAGLPTPADVGTALRAAESDPDAARAVALQAKRSGDRVAAAQYFARVLEARPEAGTLNNAANVAYASGDLPRAIALYEQSARLAPTAVAYFNLSQAYGRAIRLDDQDRALARAQQLDPLAIERLTGRVAEQAYVADAPFPARAVAQRAAATGAPRRLAAGLRARLAPGWLGSSPAAALAIVFVVLAAAAAGGSALERAAGPRDFYADLARTLRAGVGDSSQRVAELNKLRRQRARTERLLTLLALAVPGAAGFRFGRPLLALCATLAFACGLALAAAMAFAAPDPLAVGALPDLVARAAGAACLAVYALSTLLAFALRAEE